MRGRMDELSEVRLNAFNIERDLLAYQGQLGTAFTELLSSLGRRHHWIDAGAGRAQAVSDYLADDAFPEKARVTAVVLFPPEEFDPGALEARFGSTGLRYLHGRPIEQIPTADIGAADLITDVYGPLQYVREIDVLMECYGKLLKPGGRLWAILPATTVIRDGDREVPLGMWFAKIRGFRPQRLPVEGLPGKEIVLVRTEEPVQVQRLFLSRILSGPPPLREYVLLTP